VPPGRHPPAPGSPHPSTTPVAGGSFVSSGGVALSSALADSRAISLVLAESQALMWAMSPCFGVAYAFATRRQAEVCLRPLSFYGEDRASRPPPLQHRVPIRACFAPLDAERACLFRPGLRIFGRGRPGIPDFSLTAPGQRMSLSMLVLVADIAQRRAQVTLATPDRKADQNLWAARAGPRQPHPSAHSVAGGPFEGSGAVELSATLAAFRSISLVLTEPEPDVAYCIASSSSRPCNVAAS